MGLKPNYVRDYFLQSKIRGIWSWTISIAIAVIAAMIVTVCFFKSTVLQDSSMEPTLCAGDTILIDTAVYHFTTPQRGDVIVFRTGDDEMGSLHTKRVVGLPGETVQIVDGQVIVDGEVYLEQKDFPGISNAGMAEEEITLSSTQFFVLGDNRNNSEDSRHPGIGSVEKESIVGKAWFVASPAADFGWISGK